MTRTNLGLVASMEIAEEAFRARAVNPSIETVQQARVIAAAGHELGLPPMSALRNLTLIGGNITMSASLMLGICRRDCEGFAYVVVENTNERCIIKMKRGDDVEWQSFSWTMQDAERAGLLGKKKEFNPWYKYPRQMLFARAATEGCRIVCPDIVSNIYDQSEMDEDELRTAAKDHEEYVEKRKVAKSEEGKMGALLDACWDLIDKIRVGNEGDATAFAHRLTDIEGWDPLLAFRQELEQYVRAQHEPAPPGDKSQPTPEQQEAATAAALRRKVADQMEALGALGKRDLALQVIEYLKGKKTDPNYVGYLRRVRDRLDAVLSGESEKKNESNTN